MISDLKISYNMTIDQSGERTRTDKLIKLLGSLRWLVLADILKIMIIPENKNGN